MEGRFDAFDAGVLRQAIETVRSQVSVFDASVLSGSDAVELLRLFSAGEAACAAGKALAARRVETSNAHVAAGFRDATQFVASRTGVGASDAASALATARRLENLPETSARFRSGELSRSQVEAVAKAASVDPSAEASMLELAHRQSVRALDDEARRVMACATRPRPSRWLIAVASFG